MTRRGRAGSLAMELVVVVVGVLIALAADSWWADRFERQRVDAYLVALQGDMAQAETDLGLAASTLAAHAADVATFLTILESPIPAPDSTTVPYHTLTGGGGRFFLPTGMLDALLTTGDINLLPTSLRVTIIREFATLESRNLQVERFNDLMIETLTYLDLPRQELVVSGQVPAGAALSARAIQQDPTVRHGWTKLAIVFANQAQELSDMRRAAAAILEAVPDASRN